MGKKTQQAKKRLHDKYYQLAKEQGYRSRASFKLIQLNKKFNFLSNAKVCIDLCAAPGGWLQVASKNMPQSSLIVGIDIMPIKPIRNVTTMTEDITTNKCRDSLRKTLKNWKADIVLHDGAPSMGTAWIQDAFGQNELVLSSLRLAVDFLRPGGTFVSKVFRSKDYNSLLWVFNQLFKSVDVTKPAASRTESAEIFVVCRGFIAAERIDPKLFEARHVFKDLPKTQEGLLTLTKKKSVNREGYDEGDYIIFKKCPAIDFIKTITPIQILGTFYQLSFEDEESKKLLTLPKTTTEIKACCDDIKVLNKGDFKKLLKWRLQCRKALSLDKKSAPAAAAADAKEKPKAKTEDEKEAELDTQLSEYLKRAHAQKKAKKRKLDKKKKKVMEKLQLGMMTSGEGILQESAHEDLFRLPNLQKKQMKLIADRDSDDDFAEDEEEEEETDKDIETTYDQLLEQQLDVMYESFNKKRKLLNEKKVRAELPEDRFKDSTVDLDDESLPFQSSVDVHSDRFRKLAEELDDDGDDGDDEAEQRPVSKKQKDEVAGKHKSSLWFSQPFFDDLLGDEDLVSTGAPLVAPEKNSSVPLKSEDIPNAEEPPKEPEKEPQAQDESESDSDYDFFDGPSKKKRKKNSVVPDSLKKEAPQEEDAEEVELKPGATEEEDLDGYDSDEKKLAFAVGIEAVRSGRFRELLDDAYNRRSRTEEHDLPDWFVEEETRFGRPQMPITKQMVAEMKERFKEINARPAKKVAEAKARKRKRAAMKLENLKGKASSILNNSELSEKSKSRMIEQLYKSQNHKTQPAKTYVVSRNGRTGRVPKKNYKLVDPRMKKDKRGEKKAKGGKGGKAGRGGKGGKGGKGKGSRGISKGKGGKGGKGKGKR